MFKVGGVQGYPLYMTHSKNETRYEVPALPPESILVWVLVLTQTDLSPKQKNKTKKKVALALTSTSVLVLWEQKYGSNGCEDERGRVLMARCTTLII